MQMKDWKRISLVAHDNLKKDLAEWAKFNQEVHKEHELCATGTPGKLLADALSLPVHRFRSGPLGGDQQIGAKIVMGDIDVFIFFWNPLEPHPHDVDVKALLRIAVVYNVPVACNRATVDFIVSSELMHREFDRIVREG